MLTVVLAVIFLVVSGPRGNVRVAGKWINSYAGPFIATLGPWVPCPPSRSEHLIDISHLKLSRLSPVDVQTKLQIMSGHIILKVPLLSKGMTYMRAASRSNNQWKDNAYLLKLPCGPCPAMMDYFPDFTRKVYLIEPTKHTGPCVIKEGTYIADNVGINWSFPQLPAFPYGTYRTEIGFDVGTDAHPKNIMCFRTDITVHPKL